MIPAFIRVDGVRCRVTGIARRAFDKCRRLRKITIKATRLKKIGKYAIRGIYRKAVIRVPKNRRKAYKKLFRAGTGFKKSMKLKE